MELPFAPQRLNVLFLQDGSPPLEQVRAIAPERLSVAVLPPGSVVADAETEMHPPTGGLAKRKPWQTDVPPAERKRLLAAAHVLVCGLPYPFALRERMPNLRWVQYVYAGVSDFRHCDLWDAGIPVASGRGYVEALPIAEMLIAALLHFGKNLGLAQTQTKAGHVDRTPFRLRLIADKTLCIVGLGGIGQETARLAKGLGLRVVGTRRAVNPGESMPNVDVLAPMDGLPALLAEADYVALCAPLTPETENLFDAAAFARMKDGAVLMNVARGELVDEGALKDSLRSGKIGGLYTDVFRNETASQPDPELMALPNVLITPHNSGAVDVRHAFSTQLLLRNLAHNLAGEPLENLVDWARGY